MTVGGGERRSRIVALAAAVACASVLAAGCGGDSGGPVSLKWFIAIQPGGSIQKVAETCSKESGGKYDIEVELLPTDATQQRCDLELGLGAREGTRRVTG